MCIIAVSRKGAKQPTLEQLRNMFSRNPHGAGYMYARNGSVTIHKGFMTCEEFVHAVKSEHFTENDSVVYHCRIATQGGVNREMTHPFPLTSNLADCQLLDQESPVGIAHNGVIRLTSCANPSYSDTALFITEYMTSLIRRREDITNIYVNDMIHELTNSKWAIMDGVTEEIVMIGAFQECDGVFFCNGGYISPCKSSREYPWEQIKLQRSV